MAGHPHQGHQQGPWAGIASAVGCMPQQGVQEAAAVRAVLARVGSACRRLRHLSLKHTHTAGMRASHPSPQGEQRKLSLAWRLALLWLQELLRLTQAALLQQRLVVLRMGPHPRAPRLRDCSSSWLVGREQRRHSR